MARIFLSHSSHDNEAAANIRRWLSEQGFDQTFLDIDKHGGIQPGANWEKTLYREVDRSQALVLLLTPNWFDSKWCFAEFTQGRALGKAIFPIILTPAGEQIVAPDIQYLDLTTDREGGLEKLSACLREVALDAQGGFDWDRTRPPFPGLMSFQAEDAAIFFGRDDDIRRVIERLNARRIQGGARLLVLLAASGAGKSSLLRAGVLRRLARDKRNWIVLPPVRPQLRPVDELAKELALSLGQDPDWSALRDRLMGDDYNNVLEGIADQLRMGQAANEAQILVSIDQAEELFGMAEPKQAKRFSEILNHMLAGDQPYLAIAAMRADYLGQLQQAEHLDARFEEVSLKPLQIERVRQIIEGPARVASLQIDDALISRAIKDAETEDALPLLAFTLRELYERFGADGDLTLDEYLRLGDEKHGLSPLENSVRKAADDVLVNERPSDDELRALREAFVPAMVRVNEEGNYVRRPANWHDLPSKAHRLLGKFADARLLVIRQEEGDQKTIEVTHEALLRKWPTLKNWLDDEREFLIGKTQLEQSLADWQQADENVKDEGLLRGLQLNRARQWLIEHSQALSADERAFIQASIAHSDEAIRRERRRSRMITYGTLGFAAVVAIVAVVAVVQWFEADAQRLQTQALLAAMVNETAKLVRTAGAQVEKYNVPTAAALDLLQHAEDQFDAMEREARQTRELQRAKALMLMEIANNYEILGNTTKQRAHAAKAHGILADLAANNVDDLQVQRDLAKAHRELGRVLLRQGDRNGARGSYEAALDIMNRLTQADPQNAEWQHDMSVSHEKLGDVLMKQGKLPEALTSYQDSLVIRKRLVQDEPANAKRQRDLSVSYNNVGDVLMKQGKLPEALTSYQDSFDIRKRLVQDKPLNAKRQRDLSVSYNNVGNILMKQGKLPEALTSYQDSLAIRKRLAQTDLANAKWQGDLAYAYDKIAQVRVAQDDLSGARETYRDSLAIRKHIVAIKEEIEKREDGKPGSDTAYALNKLAWRALHAGEFEQALAASERGLALAPKRLLIETNRAHALLLLGRTDEARAIYVAHKGRRIRSRDKAWEQVIAEDFEALRKVGFDNPAFADIQAALAGG